MFTGGLDNQAFAGQQESRLSWGELEKGKGQTMDQALIAAARSRLYSGVISDVLDSLGHRHHALAPKIRPLDDPLVMFGRARSAQYTPVHHVPAGHNPYALEIALIDSLRPADVAVMACPGEDRIAPWASSSRQPPARDPLPAASPTVWCAMCA